MLAACTRMAWRRCDQADELAQFESSGSSAIRGACHISLYDKAVVVFRGHGIQGAALLSLPQDAQRHRWSPDPRAYSSDLTGKIDTLRRHEAVYFNFFHPLHILCHALMWQ